MKTFIVTVDPGAWADPAGIIQRELVRHFGPVQVATASAPPPALSQHSDRRIADLVERVADAMNVPAAAVVGESLSHDHVRARFAVMWLAKMGAGRSSVVIGRALGNRDHSTVLNGIRPARQMRSRDLEFRRVTSGLLREMQEGRR